MDSNLYISALLRQPCLLKTNSTRVLVTWLVTLRLIICPSSYKARPDNLIGLSISSQIFVCFSPTERHQTELPNLKCCGRGEVRLASRLDNLDYLNGKFATEDSRKETSIR